MILEFPARCVKCRGIMEAGTDAEFIRDGDGGYEHYHSGECPQKPKRRRLKYDIRECSNESACVYAAGIAFEAGYAPPMCPRCGWAWLEEAA